MADNTTKSITLKSSDGELFEVSEAVAMQSKTIHHLIEDDCATNSIPLANVDSRILAMVLEYCSKHITGTEKQADSATKAKAEEGSLTEMPEAMSPEEELKQWDDNFLDIDNDTLFHLIMAANFLDIGDLLDLTCQKVANMIKGKMPDEIRNKFGIKNDFTPEEEEEIRLENEWAFE